MTLSVGLISVFAAVALATSSVAVGQSPNTSSSASAKSGDSKVICKKQARTGTRFPDKICRTSAQWEEMRAQQQRDAEELINRPKIETSRGG